MKNGDPDRLYQRFIYCCYTEGLTAGLQEVAASTLQDVLSDVTAAHRTAALRFKARAKMGLEAVERAELETAVQTFAACMALIQKRIEDNHDEPGE